jgi:methionyl-tRNA formyltransferase
MRAIFMGTPAFAVPTLKALIASTHEVVAVYSQPPRPAGRGLKLTPSPVQQLAEQHGIAVHTPESLKPPQVQDAFRAHGADIAVVAAYGLLLPAAILEAPRLGCINIHPSDLPRWRGAAPIQRTLMAGDTETACCIIQLEAGLDTGPTHLREPFTIPPSMDAGALHDAMANIGARMTLETLDILASNPAHRPAPQASAGITYADKILKEERTLDWRKPAATLLNHIRGLAPAPCATTTLGEEVVKIYQAEWATGDADRAPGEILDSQLRINCGDGNALRPTLLQRPGKTAQNLADFLRSSVDLSQMHAK